MPLDKKKLAVIHIVKKELNLSEETYRNLLKEATGVLSAKDLDEQDLRGSCIILFVAVITRSIPLD